jgi:hypothetical protein
MSLLDSLRRLVSRVGPVTSRSLWVTLKRLRLTPRLKEISTIV